MLILAVFGGRDVTPTTTQMTTTPASNSTYGRSTDYITVVISSGLLDLVDLIDFKTSCIINILRDLKTILKHLSNIFSLFYQNNFGVSINWKKSCYLHGNARAILTQMSAQQAECDFE